MDRGFKFATGEYYHIFNRAVEKKAIFLDESDYKHFQVLLYLANGSAPITFKRVRKQPLDHDRGEMCVSVVCYGLMQNHFHIIARENKEGSISKFMGKLSTSYSMYFNTKYERSGPLFCHPFRARHISGEDYFRYVVSYVHLNPLDVIFPKSSRQRFDLKQAEEFLDSYWYSSYQDYFHSRRLESKIINKEALPIEISDLETVEQMLKEYRAAEHDALGE